MAYLAKELSESKVENPKIGIVGAPDLVDLKIKPMSWIVFSPEDLAKVSMHADHCWNVIPRMVYYKEFDIVILDNPTTELIERALVEMVKTGYVYIRTKDMDVPRYAKWLSQYFERVSAVPDYEENIMICKCERPRV